MKIGVFDSGSGGLTTLTIIRKLLLTLSIIISATALIALTATNPPLSSSNLPSSHQKTATYFPDTQVIDGNSGVARRVHSLLADNSS